MPSADGRYFCSLLVLNTRHKINEDNIRAETFEADSKRIFIEVVVALHLTAAITDDSPTAGKPRWGAYSGEVGR
ncbi:hypothetical protein KEM44_29985 [Sinorhizobium meliloti]|uniref:hypothetical protein n=1 Tax=Rhizobium meliloti TaxID=382 RepID=UPI000B5A897C|nr:hypothetical protein [Sinorhizobium meliloti]ASJ60596.1 hypothetical protein SMB554_16240 [Sinorhizobium meliloti]MCK3781769.1 hypothetical protein [Sinorhizobium meliloti]MCK3789604.1 hypothetical protein [Sinorhizobium meliloti]MCK3796499.1 hypothetical protein [Sinorhizobium meliloti]MDW9645886.1 hypothetical protein [Sinorhizobium meliloti]